MKPTRTKTRAGLWLEPFNRQQRRMAKHAERRLRQREAAREIADETGPAPDHCECPCHHGPDCCAICTNDYADLCEHPRCPACGGPVYLVSGVYDVRHDGC